MGCGRAPCSLLSKIIVLHYIRMSEQEQAQALINELTHPPSLVPVNQEPFGTGESEVTRLMLRVSQL